MSGAISSRAISQGSLSGGEDLVDVQEGEWSAKWRRNIYRSRVRQNRYENEPVPDELAFPTPTAEPTRYDALSPEKQADVDRLTIAIRLMQRGAT